jgi:hypothetical protein
MADSRKVQRKGNQYVVALPDWVRAHVRVSAGALVYWHKGKRGEVIVNAKHSRTAGPQRHEDWRERYDRAEQRIKKLQAQLQARPMRVFNEGFSQGFSQAVGGHLLEIRSFADLAAYGSAAIPGGKKTVAEQILAELREGFADLCALLETLTARAKTEHEPESS